MDAPRKNPSDLTFSEKESVFWDVFLVVVALVVIGTILYLLFPKTPSVADATSTSPPVTPAGGGGPSGPTLMGVYYEKPSLLASGQSAVGVIFDSVPNDTVQTLDAAAQFCATSAAKKGYNQYFTVTHDGVKTFLCGGDPKWATYARFGAVPVARQSKTDPAKLHIEQFLYAQPGLDTTKNPLPDPVDRREMCPLWYGCVRDSTTQACQKFSDGTFHCKLDTPRPAAGIYFSKDKKTYDHCNVGLCMMTADRQAYLAQSGAVDSKTWLYKGCTNPNNEVGDCAATKMTWHMDQGNLSAPVQADDKSWYASMQIANNPDASFDYDVYEAFLARSLPVSSSAVL